MKYSQQLKTEASKLDYLIGEEGQFTNLINDIVIQEDEKSTREIILALSRITKAHSNNPQLIATCKDFKDCLFRFYGYRRILDIVKTESHDINSEDGRSLEDLLSELNSLIGLKSIKSKVRDLISYQQVQKLRRANNLFSEKSTLHLAFTGNPGTGKTTVARIVGHIYKRIGLLSKGHFIEASRTDLIAGYQGQTALKVKNIIKRAIGGVLFIDEAYSITENDNSDSYGRECLTELTKALEDHRDNLVVIVAGYTEPMNKFFASNPGLKSRFNTFLEFDDYNADELYNILLRMCNKNDYVLSLAATNCIKEYLVQVVNNKTENFPNGRLVRNLFDDIIMNHARRVSIIENPSKDQLQIIELEDLSELSTSITQQSKHNANSNN